MQRLEPVLAVPLIVPLVSGQQSVHCPGCRCASFALQVLTFVLEVHTLADPYHSSVPCLEEKKMEKRKESYD